MSDGWRQIALTVARERAGLVEAVLESAGATALTWAELDESPAVFEPAPGQTPLWERLQLRALFAADAPVDSLRATLEEALGSVLEDWQDTFVPDRAWEREWLVHFQPQHFGHGLWVVPTDTTPPDPDGINIHLDPGLAFGTGTHPTTALCLEALAKHPPTGNTVIDYGCGSGLLGIAALKLGAKQVYAIDTDPQAVLATQENATQNGVLATLQVGLPEQITLPLADVMLANILAGVLIELAPKLIAQVRPGGRLVLSGLLKEQQASVLAAYAEDCDLESIEVRDDWCCALMQRRLSL